MFTLKLIQYTMMGVCAGTPAIDGTYYDNLTVYVPTTTSQTTNFCLDSSCTKKLTAMWEAGEGNTCTTYARAYKIVNAKDEETIPFSAIIK